MTLRQGPSLNIVEAWNGPRRRDGHLTEVVPSAPPTSTPTSRRSSTGTSTPTTLGRLYTDDIPLVYAMVQTTGRYGSR